MKRIDKDFLNILLGNGINILGIFGVKIFWVGR